MRLDDLALGPLRHVFEADRIAVFERGELHAVDEPGDEVRPAITSGISWRADTQEWRPIWTPGVVYEAPAALWRQLVLEATDAGTGPAEPDDAVEEPTPSGSPVRSWARVSAIVGVSAWTVARRRRERRDRRRPYFATDQEVREWWAEIMAGPKKKTTKAHQGRRRSDAVADDEYTLANLDAGKLDRKP